MTNKQDVLDRVRAIVAAQAALPISSVKDQTQLLGSSLDLDSLDVIEIQMELEDAFNVQLPDEEFYKAKAVEDIAQLIASKVAP